MIKWCNNVTMWYDVLYNDMYKILIPLHLRALLRKLSDSNDESEADVDSGGKSSLFVEIHRGRCFWWSSAEMYNFNELHQELTHGYEWIERMMEIWMKYSIKREKRSENRRMLRMSPGWAWMRMLRGAKSQLQQWFWILLRHWGRELASTVSGCSAFTRCSAEGFFFWTDWDTEFHETIVANNLW